MPRLKSNNSYADKVFSGDICKFNIFNADEVFSEIVAPLVLRTPGIRGQIPIRSPFEIGVCPQYLKSRNHSRNAASSVIVVQGDDDPAICRENEIAWDKVRLHRSARRRLDDSR